MSNLPSKLNKLVQNTSGWLGLLPLGGGLAAIYAYVLRHTTFLSGKNWADITVLVIVALFITLLASSASLASWRFFNPISTQPMPNLSADYYQPPSPAVSTDTTVQALIARRDEINQKCQSWINRLQEIRVQFSSNQIDKAEAELEIERMAADAKELKVGWNDPLLQYASSFCEGEDRKIAWNIANTSVIPNDMDATDYVSHAHKMMMGTARSIQRLTGRAFNVAISKLAVP